MAFMVGWVVNKRPSILLQKATSIIQPPECPISNDENHLGNMIAGLGLGAVVGGGLGFGLCALLFEETLLFTGDTVLFGALICGTLGFFLGEGFIEWLKENWSDFWW